ncbi:MAG: nickel-responsive transcriptional regulator NikR [Deltaproteobacteria bacterium]|nr:nickel-responsive transcriptional regulator NikR [Deltaproteobacteria bacterium]
MKVRRFGVSLEEDLLNKLDRLAEKHAFPNRSQAIRYLVRDALVEDSWQADSEVAGVIVLIYDHHKRNVVNHLLNIQHDYTSLILSSQHAHLDHDNCLETIVLKGRASKIQELSDRLIAIKGIKHGKLVISGPD